MVIIARARIEEIETADFIKMVGDSDLVIVDTRDIHEHNRSSSILVSVHPPSCKIEFWIDSSSPYCKDVVGQEGKNYVFHSASG